jgi:hypothetical protein
LPHQWIPCTLHDVALKHRLQMWRQKKSGRVKTRLWCHWLGHGYMFQIRSWPPKNRPFSQDIHSKILLSSRGLKLSNSKRDSRVSAFHFLMRYMPPMASWHRAHSDHSCFSVLSLDQPAFHSWKASRGLKLSLNLQTPDYNHLHIYGLCSEVTNKYIEPFLLLHLLIWILSAKSSYCPRFW